MKEQNKKPKRTKEKCFYLVAYIQPTENKHCRPVSFRWMGSDMDRKTVNNNTNNKFNNEFDGMQFNS